MTQITTTQNKTYKKIRALKQKKERTKQHAFTVEGLKSVQDALSAGWQPELLAMSETFFAGASFSAPPEIPVYQMPDSLFSALCDTETPQGILAVLPIPEEETFSPDEGGIYLFCDSVSDPGNLGTIIRTADAAGFSAVLLSDGCVDLYSPKTIRASMGSFFHLPVLSHITKPQLSAWKYAGFQILCGALSEQTVSYLDADFKKPTILVVGNEANGISEEILQLANQCIKIPIYGRAESLNVGVAAGVLMYEAARQRKTL